MSRQILPVKCYQSQRRISYIHLCKSTKVIHFKYISLSMVHRGTVYLATLEE